ncbi:exonuclease SbcCD subunit D [Cyanobium sp. NIES-981]|uniref:exonuclease SbcCD subunit D n=1 Tax=Cyanobium sp. NIES-981 TaxID=1851505 RepID=UPI0007DD2491|nr:exonuclease SbcCD subunit D [Cyanobium sp. NIES-981]SBO42235.1 Exonuclease [Cyanobium sp. NIES-981]
MTGSDGPLVRLLHTSDWHLGRSFHGHDLLSHQAEAMDRLVELSREAAVDLVVIAGDLYDRAIPPAEAVRLFTDTVARLRQGGAAVVAIAGNHDSHVRVSVYDELLSALDVTIRGRWQRSDQPVLVTPRQGGQPVAVYPLPYLEPLLDGPELLRLGKPEAEGQRLRHPEVTALAVERIRADLARRAGTRSVLVAHAFVAGGSSSESERDLSVGNAEAVPVGAFAGFDYVALGHLHGSQQLDGPRLAYSGTPLAYSFSEQHHVKSVRLVELAEEGTPRVEVVPLGVGRALRSLSGELEALLADPRLEDARGAWVRAELTDPLLPPQAMARLRQRFPHVVELRHRRPEGDAVGPSERSQRIRSAQGPEQRLLAFFADQQGRPPRPEEARLLQQALAAAGRRAD